MNRFKMRAAAGECQYRGMSRSNPAASRPTVRDVASLASVSVGTVSNVMTGKAYVSPVTRVRVERAIADLGYVPSAVARGLARGRTDLVGLLIPNVANPFFAELARGVEQVLGTTGASLLLGNSDEDDAKEARFLDRVLAHRVDGLVVVTTDRNWQRVEAIAREVPVVVADQRLEGWSGDSVLADNELGMAMAVRHLTGLGHRRIGYIGGDERLATARDRRQAFLRATAELVVSTTGPGAGRFTIASGRRQLKTLLAGPEPPTAVCAANDLLALGALLEAKKQGIRVPEQLSVIGFDDIIDARLSEPALTTIRQPAQEFGEVAARTLLWRIEHPVAAVRQVRIGPSLTIRRSTGRPRATGRL